MGEFSTFSTPATLCHIFMSRIFHPCKIVPHFPCSHFPIALFWLCRNLMCRIFDRSPLKFASTNLHAWRITPIIAVSSGSRNLTDFRVTHVLQLALCALWAYYNCDTSTIRVRFDYDSTTIRLQHATTRCEVFRALAYEIVYENQW